MWRLLISLVLFLGGCVTTPAPTSTPTPEKPQHLILPGSLETCGPLDRAREILADQFKEAPIGMGLALGGTVVIELFATHDGRTFTVLLISRDGVACVLAEGSDWSAISFNEPVRFREPGV